MIAIAKREEKRLAFGIAFSLTTQQAIAMYQNRQQVK